MMSAYNYNRAYGLLFFAYIGIGLYFVLNIFLAVVFRR